MKYRSYHRELEKTTAQIIDLFNDITIDRRDQQNNVIQELKVPCVYGNRSRILKSLENRDKTVSIPLSCVSMEGITRDSSRVQGTYDGLLYQSGSNYNNLKNTPVPVNITYTIEFITKFQEDMDQIITNWIVWFNPDVYIVIPHPLNKNQTLKIQVLWNSNNVNLTYASEIDKNTPARIVANTQILVKTWMFPGIATDDSDILIKRINFNPNIYYNNDQVGLLSNFYSVEKSTGFDDYITNIVQGYIKQPYYDKMPISANISGYWQDISASVSGDIIGNTVSGNPCYLTDDQGNLLLINSLNYITDGMVSSLSSIDNYYDYYQSTVSGKLSSY